MDCKFRKSSIAIALSLLFSSPHVFAACNSVSNVVAGDVCESASANIYSEVKVSGDGAELTFTNSDVKIDKANSAMVVNSQGKVSAVGNLTLTNQVTSSISKVVDISGGGSLSVAGDLTATSKITTTSNAPYLISINNGSLHVGGDLLAHILPDSKAGAAFDISGANAQVKVDGKATIINNYATTASYLANGTFRATNNSQAEFNELSVTTDVKEAITINSGALVTSTGATDVSATSSGGSGIWFSGKSLLSIGETDQENQRLALDRTNGQINIGQNATVKAARGIYITEMAAASVTDITIKGLIDSISDDFYGNLALYSSTAQERVFIDGGTVRGNINLGGGNDALYLTSGLLETTMVTMGEGAGVFMGTGNDHFEATGGKIIAPTIEMGTGQDTLVLANTVDISELHKIDGGADGSVTNTGEVTFKNITLNGYTDNATTDLTNGLNVYSWNTLNLNDNATFVLTGSQLLSDSTATTTNNVINIDSTSTLAADQNAVANRTIWADVNNSGQISLSNNSALGDVWTIRGNYHGDNGLLVMDVELNDDNSNTDKLIIDGNTSGTTRVKVNNIGGAGALTTEGIRIIEVAGNSDGEFTQEGRIVGGAYEYYLHKNGASAATQNDGNWYLRSELPTVTPDPDPNPNPDPGPNPNPDPGPEPEQILRPEPGAYMANHLAANTLFLMRLHDRLGETQYTDVLTGEQKVTSMWLRQIGGHNRSRDTSGQMKTQSNRYVVQIGGDVAQWSSNNLDRWHLGLMAGYANQHSNTESRFTKHQSRGKVEGYSAGVYGTWYANDEEKTGSYIDTWALYNWFDNEVKGDEFATEKYKSRGVTASVEAGYTFKLGERESDSVKYFLQPKAQVTWMNVRSNDHTDADNYRVSFDGDGNIQTRLGLRAYANGHSDIDKGKDREFEPFVEANWIHNTKDFGATMAGTRNSIAGTKNIGELKLGVEGQLSRNLDLWGNVGQQVGDKGYSDTQVILGMKYRF